jgi:DHA1 family bicyclomycin/chloramphenicol resistance-like MFS transporter
VLCLTAPSAGWLLAARTLQALGGCAGMVLGRAIQRDCYTRDMTASRMGYLVTAMAVGTMLAPGFGAIVVAVAGWRGIFVILALLAVLTISLSLAFLGETNRNLLPRLNIATLIRSYASLLRSRVFIGHALSAGCQAGLWFAFVTVMPVALVAVYQRPVTEYGLWILMPMGAYVGASYLAGRLSVRVGTAGMIRAGMLVSAVGLATLVAAALVATGPVPIFAALALYVVGNGLALPSVTAAALSVNPAITGSAAGMLGFVQWTMGMAATAAVTIAGLSNIVFLHVVIVAIGAASFISPWLTRR